MVSVEIIMKLNEGFQPFLVVIGMILISSFISILFMYIYPITVQNTINL